jgi:hypothetical protein
VHREVAKFVDDYHYIVIDCPPCTRQYHPAKRPLGRGPRFSARDPLSA